MERIDVNLGARSYPISIGEGLLADASYLKASIPVGLLSSVMRQ